MTYLGSGQSVLRGFGADTLQNSTLGVTKQVNESGTSYYARTAGGLLVDERLPSGSDYNPIYDAQDNIVGLLNSSGELVQTIRYGPYGENTNATSYGLAYSATNDPFTFQGGYHALGGNAGKGNVANGLYHFGERYYDPTTGRWTQPDPASEGYIFAGNDPINENDPDGTCPFDRNLQPSIFSQGNYTYIQICGTHGRNVGKLVGYLRVSNSAYKHGESTGASESILGRIIGGTVGAVVTIAGLGGGTLCAAATVDVDPIVAMHCVGTGTGVAAAGMRL